MNKLIFILLLLVLDASMKTSVPNAMNNHSDSEDEIQENNQRQKFFSELKTNQDNSIRSIQFGKNFTFYIGEKVLVRDNTDSEWNRGAIVEITPEVLVQLIDTNDVIGFPWQYIKKIKVRESIIRSAESSDSEEIEEKDFTPSNQIALKQEFQSQNLTNRPAIRKKASECA